MATVAELRKRASYYRDLKIRLEASGEREGGNRLSSDLIRIRDILDDIEVQIKRIQAGLDS